MSYSIYDKVTKKLIPIAGNNEATVASLDSLSNVSISSPVNEQVLRYDAINGVWINDEHKNLPMALSDIVDVKILSIQDGQIIKWNDDAHEWQNVDLQEINSLGQIPNVNLSNLADGDFLIYDFTTASWTNLSLTAGYGIDITNGVIKTKTFTGTTAAWDALSPADQSKYVFVNLTDDYDEAHEIKIAYVDELPLSGIQDMIYGLLSYDSDSATVGANFLDSEDAFTKTTTTDGYIYTSDVVKVSTDGVTYTAFDTLEYDGTDFILNGTTTLDAGDTFYWKEIASATYYAGNQATQSVTEMGANIPIDSAPTEDSPNAVSSGGVYTALDNKQSKTLTEPITIEGVPYSTVESALIALNSLGSKAESGGNVPINPSSTNDINMWVVTD